MSVRCKIAKRDFEKLRDESIFSGGQKLSDISNCIWFGLSCQLFFGLYLVFVRGERIDVVQYCGVVFTVCPFVLY